MLHIEPISCVILNCVQYRGVISSHFSKAHQDLLEGNITGRLLFLYLDIVFRYVAISDSFSLVALLMQYMTLFKPENKLNATVSFYTDLRVGK